MPLDASLDTPSLVQRQVPSRRQDPSRFVSAIGDEVRRRLPERLRDFAYTPRYRLGQVGFGMKGLHYEVWLHDTTQHLEIGFHMEADAATNAALYDYLEDELPWLKAQLGPCIELERWDKGWCRLYRTIPLGPLTAALLDTTCVLLADLIQAVQPLCEDWWAERPTSTVPGTRPGKQATRARSGGHTP
jgi:hypothetical protein